MTAVLWNILSSTVKLSSETASKMHFIEKKIGSNSAVI